MKRFIAIIFLLLALAGNASAMLPIVYFTASALIHAAAVGGYVWFASSTNTSNGTVTSNGNLAHSTNVQWVDLSGSSPVLNTKTATVKVNLADVKTKVAASPSKYSNLNNALIFDNVISTQSEINSFPNLTAIPSGTVVLASNGQKYILGSYINTVEAASTLPVVYLSGPVGIITTGTPSNQSNRMYARYNATPTSSTPSSTPATAAQFASALSGTSSGGSISSPAIQTEWDAFLNSEGGSGLPDAYNIIHYVDTPVEGQADTASALSLPSAPTATQVANAKLSDSTTTAQTAAAGSVAAAQAAYDANPTAENLRLLNEAKTRQAEIDAQIARDQLNQQSETFTTPSSMTPYLNGDASGYNVTTRFQTFISNLKQSALFSLPNKLMANIPTGGTSIITVSAGSLGTASLDLQNFSSSLAIMRILCLMSFSVLGIKIILLKGGGG